MRELVLIMLTAALADNYVFAKCYGFDGISEIADSPRKVGVFGVISAVVMSVSAAIDYALYHLLLAPLHVEYLKLVVFVLASAAVVWLVNLLCDRLFPNVKACIRPLTVCSAALAASLENIESGRSLVMSVLFSLFAAVGILIATLLFSSVKEKLKLSSPPSAFDGAPIALIATGLTALALSGFFGMAI